VLESFGILPEYYDLWGKPHRISQDVALSLLQSLGVDGSSPEALAAAINLRMRRKLVPETSVLTHGCLLDLRPAQSFLPLEVVFHWEDGSTLIRRGGLEEMRELPAEAPFGYHSVTVRCGAEAATASLIITPERAKLPDRRMNGLAVSVYSLRSSRNQGCGDFTDLKAVCTWAREHLHADFIALNPLHAIPNRQPYNTSPYLPTTTLYRNFLYLDLEAVDGCPALPSLDSLRETPCVEYEKVARLKLGILRLCFRKFLRQGGSTAFDAFRVAQGESLRLFATYQALDAAIHRAQPQVWLWQDWPADYQHPESPAVERFAQEHPRTILFYQWLQWQIDLQLASAQKHAVETCGMQIGLYHDLALATDRSGFDAWAFRDFYAKGCRVGSPPDDFAPEGQDWSFPPPNVERHRLDGYRLFARAIRNNCAHGGALRLDHVMRLFRLFWIPDGVKAMDGAYVRDNASDLLRILALESHRNNVLIIGEDLGTITDEMRAGLLGAGILSYRLLYFEREWDGRFKMPHEYPAQALVCTTTHDLPTLAGFWTSHDIAVRKSVGLILDEAAFTQQKQQRRSDKERMLQALIDAQVLHDRVDLDAPALPDAVRDAVLRFLQLTPSWLFAVTQDDLTGFEDQQNMPGTTWQHPNWRHKMPVAIEDLQIRISSRS
jgi:4-alpha-glucanotransferase